MKVVTIIILSVGLFSSLRILVGILLSILNQRSEASIPKQPPLLSVIIPAYNEEQLIEHCVLSVVHQTYHHRQIIVVNDGSQDQTLAILEQLKCQLAQSSKFNKYFTTNIAPQDRLIIVNQANQGKSAAINNCIRNYVQGSLVTVLDADSSLAPDAIAKMVMHFADPRVIAMADNVRIAHPHNLIDLVQQFEYMLGYRLKGSEPVLRLEYIIGGVGSTFRKWALEAVDYYDTDTVTEDIDLTMKLISHFGNKKYIIGYANDVIAYTPAVHNFRQLVKQRYRWKLGRFQSLFKHNHLIFSRHLRTYTLTLSWWKLPKIFVEEFFILIEPALLAWMIWLTFDFADFSMFLTILVVYFVFALLSFSFEHLCLRTKVKLFCLAPFAYLFMYVINIVDFICLIKCIIHFQLIFTPNQKTSWEHVDR